MSLWAVRNSTQTRIGGWARARTVLPDRRPRTRVRIDSRVRGANSRSSNKTISRAGQRSNSGRIHRWNRVSIIWVRGRNTGTGCSRKTLARNSTTGVIRISSVLPSLSTSTKTSTRTISTRGTWTRDWTIAATRDNKGPRWLLLSRATTWTVRCTGSSSRRRHLSRAE